MRLLLIVATACGRVSFAERGDAGDGSGAPGDDGPASDALDDSMMPPVALVADDFERAVGGGWGSAPIGGAWNVYNPDGASLGVAGGTGNVSVTAEPMYADFNVTSAAARDVETRFVVEYGRLPATGEYIVIAVARWVANSTAYDLRTSLLPDGSLSASLTYEPGTSGPIELTAPATVLTGVTPPEPIVLALRVTGASPTTLCGRIWRQADAEPLACTVSAQDSTAVLQAPGIAFLAMGVSAGTVPVTFSFDDFRYDRVGAQ